MIATKESYGEVKAKERKKQSRRAQEPEPDKLPPHSIEAEQGVLGCILLQPSCLGDCAERFNRRSDPFYDLRHQHIFDALMTMRRAGEGLDVITLQQFLKDDGLLEQVGGIGYISSLQDAVPSAANVSYYLDIVWEKYELRRILSRCTEVAARVQDYQGDVAALLTEVRRDLSQVTEIDVRGKCQRFKVSDLEDFDLSNDENNLVGDRYLTRGSSLLINGPSGRGKSSLLMLRIILWALGQPFYGMKVVRPLSAVIWQTENNQGDLAKAFQGARNFLKLNPFEHGKEYEQLENNVEFVYCPALCGREFLEFAEAELTKRPRDLAILDPLVSFPEGDINGQQGAAEFLRKGLSRISFLTGSTWIINHHTPKPLRDPRSSGRTKKVSEYQYGGAGSFDIPGWARAVETLEESTDGVFRLVLAKRGGEAAATHPDGTPTQMLWLRHATDGGIHWEQMEPPQEAAPSENKGGKPNDKQRIAGSNLHGFCEACLPEGEGLNVIAKRLEQWLAAQNDDLAPATCKRIIPLLVKNGKLAKGADSLYRKGANA